MRRAPTVSAAARPSSVPESWLVTLRAGAESGAYRGRRVPAPPSTTSEESEPDLPDDLDFALRVIVEQGPTPPLRRLLVGQPGGIIYECMLHFIGDSPPNMRLPT